MKLVEFVKNKIHNYLILKDSKRLLNETHIDINNLNTTNTVYLNI